MSTVAADTAASYAAEVARLLWPEPWQPPYVLRSRHHDDPAHRDAYLFPSERRPRLLVPADVPGSASMLRRLGRDGSPLARPMRSLLERSVGSRAFAHARWPVLRVPATDPAADSIEHHLASCLGTEVRVGVLLGTRRANQKPVLQVFGRDGTLLGYAKVGHTDVTAALVRREADALAELGRRDPRSFRAPRLLHHGRWAGLEVLVMSPLPTSPRQRLTRTARLAAMREVAELAGTTSVPLAESGFWARLRDAVGRTSGEPVAGRLRSAAATIEARHGSEPLAMGGWHGDWGRWNMAVVDGVVQLWDWERYDPQVPLGFDGLHYAVQCLRPGARDAQRREASFLRTAREDLAVLGVGPGQRDLTLQLYLLEIADRYADGLAHGATPALRRRTSWVLSLLERLTGHPAPAPTPEGRP